ncbi:MAG: DNA-processing protein DprA [Clostridia bacterium]|nr:DNA-processing protein DprA [Clostridia bacterium]
MKYIEIKIIKIQDENYPKLLREVYDPPKQLYVQGNINIFNNPSIAIVGCREPSEYGKKAAQYFSYNLAKQNINIVSGLAKGIDSFAHIGALQAKGKTIAVIGSGLDIIYPKENEKLAQEIIKNGGAIISEYPLGTRPEKDHFPARNRIISGLCKGVLVVEAKEKSGSLITADFAMEQGKEVFAVPGNINSLNSVGTNMLIKDGAIPVCNYNDVIQYLL